MTYEQIDAVVDELRLYDAIAEVRERMVLPYPERPKKPFMKANTDSSEVEVYLHELRAWEKAKELYDEQVKQYQISKDMFESAIESYIKQAAGLYTIPEKSQQKVWERAWRDGHSEGYHRVYEELIELIDLF